ncbi:MULTISPECIES: ROK family protein [Agrobacterium]|jgi:N-acetylglucosamine kinase|uniref:N-acetylglucosamine kinase n=4 Tax=Agrobacterium tumefaciens complex TaxID=1183400 RepID=A0AAP4YSV5_AGRTU|nr:MULTISPECIES: ROK family protein [Agrobacterium]MCP2133609.1 N-acetylglucosamine kinase [Rhizobium sp. SLBN-94]TGE77991.1 ROK family protein [Rhizobium sp. SEMIA 439]AYM82247.1 ROK family transcriptional regulator [Agrobacterium tumefaciens]EHH06401.1 ROK family transcriptional regulator [Agrobacterium tumefaciens CCNWGS0286]EPR08922.1 N-acetylglucosamine kinase [Agrobacterium radiobacter DSM 30147]
MIVCFDIGGTTIKGAIAYAPDDIRPVPRIPTPKTSFEDFAAGLKSIIDNSGGTPACVSLSIAGVIDADTGKATVANIQSIHGRVLKDELEKALHLPVIVSNDADCFVIAESEIGSGRGHRVVFGVILGTGVGGGLVIDGKLINSDGGFAGEWGHGPVAATLAGNPPVSLPRFECGCGLSGCVDAIGSARGMEKLHSHLHRQEMTSEDIIAAWQAGDAKAARTIDVLIDILASPLAMVINVTGATIVPVGGGLSNSKALLAALDEVVRSRILRRFDRPLVVPAICRIEPGLIGSAVIGLKYEKEAAGTA